MPRQIDTIVLATANARFIHPAMGLRYLYANMEEYQNRTHLLEFTLTDRAGDIAERIMSHTPTVVALSVYMWNLCLLFEVVDIIKQIAPGTTIILGGPEVSFSQDAPPINARADYVVCGEGEAAFLQLLRDLEEAPPSQKTIVAPPLALDTVALPYALYTEADIAHRTVYIESSRGCPFGCEFCISSLDTRMRQFPLSDVIKGIIQLRQRGVERFKFVDRTIHGRHGLTLLTAIRDLPHPLFAHFEIVPDRLSEEMISLLASFPPGTIQLEAGVQTFNETVARRIHRIQNMEKLEKTLSMLVETTTVHVHADLVAGLPGETMESFAMGFNRLWRTGVHEIQVGILKRLRGAPISRHSACFAMKYRQTPPYDILCNRDISFTDMQRIKRFARYFDLVCNNGHFKHSIGWIISENPFDDFMTFCDWLYAQTGKTSHIALDRLAGFVFDFSRHRHPNRDADIADSIQTDWVQAGRRRLPKTIQAFFTSPAPAPPSVSGQPHTVVPKRQLRHLT